jgi:CheY-like chemotaxis protein
MPKVLVVEDQPSTVAILRYHLESAGFDEVVAGDIQEGWRLLTSEFPDAAVVDIRLPSEDGWTLIRRVRADARFADLPIVVLTGSVEPETMDLAKSLRCDYLAKPFAASALVAKVRALVEERQKRFAVPPPPPSPSQRIQMVPVRVVLLLDAYRIEGTCYLPPELGRFSDAWESVMRDNRSYIPLTDARISSIDGEGVAAPAFTEVRKADVRAVFPSDQPVA